MLPLLITAAVTPPAVHHDPRRSRSVRSVAHRADRMGGPAVARPDGLRRHRRAAGGRAHRGACNFDLGVDATARLRIDPLPFALSILHRRARSPRAWPRSIGARRAAGPRAVARRSVTFAFARRRAAVPLPTSPVLSAAASPSSVPFRRGYVVRHRPLVAARPTTTLCWPSWPWRVVIVRSPAAVGDRADDHRGARQRRQRRAPTPSSTALDEAPRVRDRRRDSPGSVARCSPARSQIGRRSPSATSSCGDSLAPGGDRRDRRARARWSAPVLGALWVVGLPAFFPDNELVPLFTSSLGPARSLLLYFPGGFVQIGVRAHATGSSAWADATTRARAPPDQRRPAVRCSTPLGRSAPADGVPALRGRRRVGALRRHRRGRRRLHRPWAPDEIVGLIGTNGAGQVDAR